MVVYAYQLCSNQENVGNINVVDVGTSPRREWNESFIDELEGLMYVAHDMTVN